MGTIREAYEYIIPPEDRGRIWHFVQLWKTRSDKPTWLVSVLKILGKVVQESDAKPQAGGGYEGKWVSGMEKTPPHNTLYWKGAKKKSTVPFGVLIMPEEFDKRPKPKPKPYSERVRRVKEAIDRRAIKSKLAEQFENVFYIYQMMPNISLEDAAFKREMKKNWREGRSFPPKNLGELFIILGKNKNKELKKYKKDYDKAKKMYQSKNTREKREFMELYDIQLQLPKNWVVIRDETGTILYYYKPEFTWTKNRNDVKDFSPAKKTKAPKKTKGSKKTFKKRKKRKNITFKK